MPQKSTGLELAQDIWGRRKWLAVAVWLWTLGAAGTATIALPNMYSATATLLVERQQVPEALVRSAVTGALETRLQTISQGILGRSRLEELILRFDLYPGLRREGSVEAAVEQMRRDIHVQPIGGGPGQDATVAFSVSYDGWDPRQVADIAGVLASFYIDENLRMREEQASGTTEFLKAQLDQMKAQLDERAAWLNEFRQRHAWELSDQLGANLATLERLNAQLALNADTQKRTLERRGELVPTASPRALDPADTRLAELRGELSALRARVTDAHPDLIRLRGEIAALEEQVRTTKTNDSPSGITRRESYFQPEDPISEIDAELMALKNQERSLRQDIAEYERRVENTPRREPEFRKLSRDYEAASDAYYSLLKRYQDAQLAESLEQGHRGEYFRTLDPPLPPEQPVAPNRLRLLLMSVVLSLGLAAAAAVVAEKLDTSFHTVDELRVFTRASIAATIPRIVTSADSSRRWRRVAVGALGVVCVLAVMLAASWSFAHGNENFVRLLDRGR